MTRIASLRIAAALALLLLAPATGSAELRLGALRPFEPGAGAATERAEGQRSDLTLIRGWREPDGARMAGLRIALEPGWKTYWRMPGEAGIPPVFDWSGSGNVASVEVLWPRPVAFESFGMTTLGYRDEVVLPLRVTPVDPAQPVRLSLSLAYGVCSDICMPEMQQLTIDLRTEAEGERAALETALAALPVAAADAGAEVIRCGIVGAGDARRLEAVLRLPEPSEGRAFAVVEAPEPLWFGPAKAEADGALVRVTAPIDPISTIPAWLDRGSLRLTLLHSGGAVDFRGCGG